MKMLRAEDALADALLAALNTWARDGIPRKSAGMAPDRRTQSSPGSQRATSSSLVAPRPAELIY
jgi:hypothetical protein